MTPEELVRRAAKALEEAAEMDVGRLDPEEQQQLREALAGIETEVLRLRQELAHRRAAQ